ncbi:tripartite tricarboxylate transporter TctB family protein [Saccharomonospora azurea]|uniref:Tripartite tricarboxylate transporter TctB family n=1 Tax=Saccharomonospora azurea NA-128 TaxID=882081 RepID=H8G8V4_9PSEU|nr:tripartite tricarboxylate transporter TctB family protein [Saccharomonospora azurea]EHY89470.1 Tripartite tricarboxylate transporter TctB family [Saccharomonospora azurea NA-128]
MSAPAVNTTDDSGDESGERSPRRWWQGRGELGLCAFLFALGVLVIVDAMSLPTDFTQRGPLGPKAVPVVVGSLLLLVSALLARDVLRGGRGEAEGGEDIDLSTPPDRRTVLILSGAFLANAALIDVVGFPLSSALMFWGTAYALGSRNTVRDPLIAAVLSVTTWFVFNELLGVSLPGGPLMEVL